MAGYLEVWAGSLKQHDGLIRSLRELTLRTTASLEAIHSNLMRSAEQTESIAVRAARDAGIEYGGRNPEEPLAFGSLDVIIRTLSGPRQLMTREQVEFYRSRIRSILKLSEADIRESAKLASSIKRGRECLKKLERFYSMKDKPAGARKGRRKPATRPKRSR